MLIPGKLLLAPSPAALPAGETWADVSDAGRPAERRFAAGLLADVLADLGTSAAAWLGRAGEGDAAAVAARGLDVHELGLDERQPALLAAMDRLLAVARAAPGAVAVFGGGGANGAVAALAAAWLMTLGFDGGAAEAWLRLVCPPLAGPLA